MNNTFFLLFNLILQEMQTVLNSSLLFRFIPFEHVPVMY